MSSTVPTPSPEQVEQINTDIRYAMYSVFRSTAPLGDDRPAIAAEVSALLSRLEDEGLVVRGLYDVSGLRADADLLVWWHAQSVELVQAAYQRLRRTELGRHLEPVWSNVGLHRPAEFNRGHVPAFLAGEPPRKYLCVYPFVRSYEWYLMEEGERRDMLREHGLAAKDYGDVRANTIASFALGDYEWLLAFEADELHRIVDLMRELRNTRARLHVREELPFFTGPRVEVEDLVAALP
ncbi:MAG: chlorite dismutase family protein [Actinomycetota bacterium]|jgi:chlorite dismutase|nr:chlorite dismutase family protein [Actinomycetota bacterium]